MCFVVRHSRDTLELSTAARSWGIAATGVVCAGHSKDTLRLGAAAREDLGELWG